MPNPRTFFGLAPLLILGAALAGCAQPEVLLAPAHTPAMAKPADANPIPAYAKPDPSPHADPRQDQTPSPATNAEQ